MRATRAATIPMIRDTKDYHAFHGLAIFVVLAPRACAQGFMPAPAPQAKAEFRAKPRNVGRRFSILATLLACALGSTLIARAQGKPQKFVQDGVEIEFTIEPATKSKAELMAGQQAVVRFR